MKAQCKIVRLDIPSVLQGLSTDEERKRVEEHLNTCPECMREWASMKETFGLLSQETERPGPGDAYWNALVPAINEKAGRQRPSKAWTHRFAFRLMLPLTAVLVVLFMVYRTDFIPRNDATGLTAADLIASFDENDPSSDMMDFHFHG